MSVDTIGSGRTWNIYFRVTSICSCSLVDCCLYVLIREDLKAPGFVEMRVYGSQYNLIELEVTPVANLPCKKFNTNIVH